MLITCQDCAERREFGFYPICDKCEDAKNDYDEENFTLQFRFNDANGEDEWSTPILIDSKYTCTSWQIDLREEGQNDIYVYIDGDLKEHYTFEKI